MPLMKYYGTAVNYMRGSYKFSRDKDKKVLVADADVAMFLDQSNPENVNKDGRLLFEVIEEELPTEAEQVNEVRTNNRIGNFLSKGAALSFALDQYGVVLSAALSLPEMNRQTVDLFQRTSSGNVARRDLLKGLRGATFAPESGEEDGGIDTGEDDVVVKRTESVPEQPPVIKKAAAVGDLSPEEEEAIFDEETSDKPAPGIDPKLVAHAAEVVAATSGARPEPIQRPQRRVTLAPKPESTVSV